MGLSLRERNLGCRDLVITLSEFFRPWESVPPARQNVWSEKGLMMELQGYRRADDETPPKGRKLARDGGGKTQSWGERISE